MKNIKIILAFIFLSIFNLNGYSQTNTYNAYLKNIAYTNCKTLEFEIWLEWTGTNTQKFMSLGGGIIFNYVGLSNGGTITGAFVPGSADVSLPTVQQSPNWNVNQTSKQIRLFEAVATPSTVAAVIPAPPGFRIGKFRMVNTVDFTIGATPDFAWAFSVGSSSTTQTKINCYLGGSTIGTTITDQNTHFVENNPAFILNCVTSAPEIFADEFPSLNVFPNPTSDKLTVSLYSKSRSNVTLKIFDICGKEILRDNFNVVQGENTKDLFMNNVSKGIYFLQLVNEEVEIKTLKVVVE